MVIYSPSRLVLARGMPLPSIPPTLTLGSFGLISNHLIIPPRPYCSPSDSGEKYARPVWVNDDDGGEGSSTTVFSGVIVFSVLEWVGCIEIMSSER